ncbi:MAG: phosphoglucomutase/phosphomannomutase family protein [Chloroflexota bacterium]|nr:phosphoglucomutase/phosphomannomutase family protein [Chloroflexota bacterium]
MPTTIHFGTDGWRAVIADTYTFDNVRLAAQACAEYFKASGKGERGIAVGYDTRFGSDRFARAAAEVLAGNGIHVLLSDRFQPTPVISYSIMDRQLGGAIIITASHNPGTDNGFKVKSDIGASAPPEVVEQIEAAIDRLEPLGQGAIRRLAYDEAAASGSIELFDAMPAYQQQIGRLLDLDGLRTAGITVVADSMYGTGQGYFKRLLSGGSTRVQEIRDHLNPAFPGIAPEPIRPHVDELMRVVSERGAHIGLATDGDSDRIGLVAEDGSFVNQHQVFGLLVLYLTEQRGLRGAVARSVTMTSMADHYLEQLGVPVFETPVGFKYIGSTMVAENAILGGEESGGFGFHGHLPERDALVAGLFLVDLMVRLGRPMSGVLDYMREKLGDWHYLRLDVRYPAAERQAIAERVAAARPEALDGSKVVSISTRDGYKFYAEDGSWLLIRFSGTEPLLRIYTETTGPERVQRLLQQGRELAGA